MTQAQRRATERAYAQGIRVVNDYGEGSDRTLTVTSSAGIFGPDYTVTRGEHGTLACTCQAGQHGLVCKHRAAVHEYLVREHERELARERARARRAA